MPFLKNIRKARNDAWPQETNILLQTNQPANSTLQPTKTQEEAEMDTLKSCAESDKTSTLQVPGITLGKRLQSVEGYWEERGWEASSSDPFN